MSWTLNDQTPEALNIVGASLALRSQGQDVLTISFAAPCDEPPIAAGTSCELKWGDSIVFAGEAILPGGTGEASRDSSDLVIAGPWRELEKIIYRTGSGSSTSVRLRFPSDPASTAAVMLQDCVATVLTHAIGRGAPIAIGTIDLAGEIPSQEFDGLPVSQILINLLRFAPGAAVWFDYSESPAVIHVEKAAGLPSLSLSGPGCKGLRVDHRTDFQIPGTQLIYRKKITSNHGEAEGVSIDSSGSVDVSGTLIMPLDLGPARVQYELLSNRLIVGLADTTVAAWWQAFLPEQTVAAVLAVSPSGDSDLTHYIAAGELPDWMLSHIDGEANAAPHGCTGPLAESPAAAPSAADAFSETAPAPHTANASSFKLGRRKFTAALNIGTVEAPDYRTYALELPCTNCTASGTYYRETLKSWDPGEPVPTGLAEAFQDSCSRLAYSGRFSVKQIECTPDVHRPGKALNITSTAAAAWSTMRSPIQTVDHDLIGGESSLVFGPPTRLGPSTLLELIRASRARKTPGRSGAEEEPAIDPIAYQAAAVTANQSPEPAPESTANLTVNCEDEDGDAFSDGAFFVAGQVYPSGSSAEIPPGSYTVVFLPVLGRKTPNNLTGSIAAGGTATRSGRYYLAEEVYLEDQSDETNWAHLKALSGAVSLYLNKGSTDPIGFQLDAALIEALAVPTGKGMLAPRLIERCDGQKMIVLGGPWFSPE